MNINNVVNGIGGSVRSNPVSADGSKKAPATNASSGDKVSLSNIQKLEDEIKSFPEVNDAAVEKVRAAIANGEYKIDYEKLAGKMLDFEGI